MGHVRLSVRPSSDLRNYLYDLFDMWHDYTNIPWVGARLFEFKKKSKKAHLWHPDTIVARLHLPRHILPLHFELTSLMCLRDSF